MIKRLEIVLDDVCEMKLLKPFQPTEQSGALYLKSFRDANIFSPLSVFYPSLSPLLHDLKIMH